MQAILIRFFITGSVAFPFLWLQATSVVAWTSFNIYGYDVNKHIWLIQPDLTAIRTYFTRWLIRTNSYDLTRTNSYDFC